MRSLLIPAVATVALLAAGCSEQIDDHVNGLAASALETAVSQQLEQAGITLQEPPDCETDLTRDGASLTGDASCEAVSADGADVQAEFDGTLSASGCSGSLGVKVGGETVVQLDEIPDCSVEI